MLSKPPACRAGVASTIADAVSECVRAADLETDVESGGLAWRVAANCCDGCRAARGISQRFGQRFDERDRAFAKIAEDGRATRLPGATSGLAAHLDRAANYASELFFQRARDGEGADKAELFRIARIDAGDERAGEICEKVLAEFAADEGGDGLVIAIRRIACGRGVRRAGGVWCAN